ncbi:MAG TPA: hypothetical protein PKE29_18945, partial [Phycisphaerales bacterium]|nr:hypothetical protein [Phycisphaerales bacterium]
MAEWLSGRVAKWAGAAAAGLCAGGCGVGTVPLEVRVREAGTDAAVVGAGVEVDSMALGPSLEFGDVVDELLGKRGARSSRGMTDSRGVVVVEYVKGRAVRLAVVRGFEGPWVVTMDPIVGGTGGVGMVGEGDG